MQRQSSGGVLAEFTPFKEQEQFLRGDKRYLGYISGVGAGKTYAGIIRTVLNMQRWNPGEMGAIVAPTRQMIVNVIIPEMRDLGLLDKWEYKSSYSDEPGLHSPNGSRALILSADNDRTIERLRGLNLAWGWIDEESVVDPRAREILQQRLRTGSYRNLYMTTTPKGKNHTYEFFVGDVGAEQREYGEATIYETEERLAIVGVPTHANPHTPEDYKEAMAADLPEEVRAQEVQGQFVEIGGGMLRRDMLTFVEPSDIPENGLTYVVGVDLGVQADSSAAREQDSDYWCAALLATHQRRGEAYLIDIHRERGLTLREGLTWLSGLCEPVPSPVVAIESNNSQRWLAQEASEIGLNVQQVQNTRPKEERLVELSIPFENNTVRLVDRGDGRFDEFVNEWIAFPEGSHDDTLDAVQIAVDNSQLTAGTGLLGADPYGLGDRDVLNPED